jgi:hypothetical protein
MGANAVTLPPRPVTITRRLFGYVVNPGTFTVDLAIGLGEAFDLRNRTQLDATVTFPPDRVLDERGVPIRAPFDLAPGVANDRHLRVNLEYKGSFFEYAVLMRAADIEAQGGSRPGIEIVR